MLIFSDFIFMIKKRKLLQFLLNPTRPIELFDIFVLNFNFLKNAESRKT
ncbi:hypothetical protein L1276_002974 [Flavobacterium sp. HSC-32F16]|nr:hypothetical protein [Flavobacterium sp. HSC-32F16]